MCVRVARAGMVPRALKDSLAIHASAHLVIKVSRATEVFLLKHNVKFGNFIIYMSKCL